jgi:outer membrane cobalamin receptor
MIFALVTLWASDPIDKSIAGPQASDVVIVRAERLKSGAIPVDVISLSGTALQDQTAVRLDEALRVVPGIGLFRRTPSGAANATIQGISLRPIAPNGAGRALVSLDGVPQNDPFGGWVYWGRYDPTFLQRVDIARGGAGAGYGPMALTGTLDLVEARGLEALTTASIADAGGVHLASRHSLQTEGANFTAMAVYDATDGDFALAPSKRGLVDERIDNALFSATLVADIGQDNGAWSFRASGFDERKGAGVKGGRSGAYGLDISAARRIEGPWGQARFLVYGQGRDFSNQAVSVGVGRVTSTPTLDQFATPSSALGGSIIAQGRDGSVWPRVTLDWRRAEGETRELFRYIGSAFTRNRVAGGQQDLLGLGFASVQPLRLGQSGLSVEGGLRLDQIANGAARRLETDRASGAVTLSEQPRDTQATLASGRLLLRSGPVSLSAYRTFRPPTLNELHRPFRIGNDVTEANAALKPETLSGLDLNMVARRTFAIGTFDARTTLYANRLYGPITNVTLGTGPGNFPRVGFLPAGGALRERRNAGQIDAIGLEASVAWSRRPSGPNVQFSVSATDARVDGGGVLPQLTGKRPVAAPRWSLAAQGRMPLGPKNSVSVLWRAESKRFDDDLNTRVLPAYNAIDVRTTWARTADNYIFLEAENLLDTQIATARSGDDLISLTQGRVVRIGIQFTR